MAKAGASDQLELENMLSLCRQINAQPFDYLTIMQGSAARRFLNFVKTVAFSSTI